MGQASRRGTFEERKAKAVIKRKEMVKATLAELESPDPELSPEDKKQQSRGRFAVMSMMAAMKRSGLTQKEFTRRLKRYNKKG